MKKQKEIRDVPQTPATIFALPFRIEWDLGTKMSFKILLCLKNTHIQKAHLSLIYTNPVSKIYR